MLEARSRIVMCGFLSAGWGPRRRKVARAGPAMPLPIMRMEGGDMVGVGLGLLVCVQCLVVRWQRLMENSMKTRWNVDKLISVTEVGS